MEIVPSSLSHLLHLNYILNDKTYKEEILVLKMASLSLRLANKMATLKIIQERQGRLPTGAAPTYADIVKPKTNLAAHAGNTGVIVPPSIQTLNHPQDNTINGTNQQTRNPTYTKPDDNQNP